MSDVMEAIENRRSVRKYEDKEIPEAVLEEILKAVQWAPSWANTQCWEIVVVKSASTKKRIEETIAPKNPATRAITEAPVVLAVCGKLKSSGYYKDVAVTKFGDWYLFDLGIATQNICLAAHALGLGTVIVGLFDHEKLKGVLNVPTGYEAVALIPVGYPAKIPKAPKRRDIGEFRHDEAFSVG